MLDRRKFLQLGTVGLGVLGFGRVEALAAAKKKLIVLWMEGGPSQLDTFDPKPGTDEGGPFGAIATAASGIRISEHLPLIAKEMKSIALVRSVVSREGNHPRARYLLHTGHKPGGGVRHPSLGAVVAHELGRSDESALPAFVSIGGIPIGSGFLGAAYAPFLVREPGAKDENITPETELAPERAARRASLLGALETTFASRAPELAAAHRATRERAVAMMSSEASKAFDISGEPERVRAAYGDNEFGRGVLAARRLIEAGARVVEVALGGWDTHADNFDKVSELSSRLDPAMAALLADLRARGLLDDTLVVWMGEFGRTPRINARMGRDHFAQGYSVALAGAGVRGGVVVGATSDDGQRVVERPVSVPELFATIYAALGVELDRVFRTPVGRPIAIVDDEAKPLMDIMRA